MSACVALCALLAAAGAPAQPRPSSQAIVGTVMDATGAVLPGAPVTLATGATAGARTATTDAAGTFRFDRVPPGRYQVHVEFPGFRPATIGVTVGARSPARLRVTLAVAGVDQEVTVRNQAPEVSTAPATNADAMTVDLNTLESLPIFDEDIVAAASRFLDTGALGNGGVTIVVNGMEVNALRVSPSAVQQITINQDPYSAEYSRPGRGRIEILTKPGSAQFHGEGNLFWRDAVFDARNAFATVQPMDRKHILEGVFSGPAGRNGKTSFLLSASDDLEDQQAIVYAAGPTGAIHEVAPQPRRRTLVAGSLTFQVSPKTTISIRPSYEYESLQNRGVGGTTLSSAGTDFEHREEQVVYTQQTILRPTLLAQFQLLVGHEREPTASVSPDRGIVVAGAFVGGGAQGDLLRTETHAQMVASVGWTHGRHFVQAGFQVPDWSRRGFYDRTLAAGKYFFASLADYAAGRPYSFVQNRGNGDLAFLEKLAGAYVKDDWRVRPGLTASFGVRYDWQNYFGDTNNIAPRFSLAYAPGGGKTNVIRLGAGIFNDRSGPVAIADLLHSQPGGLSRYVITSPAYPDPSLGNGGATGPPGIVQLAPDVQLPQTFQYSVGVDHQLTPTLTLSVTYTGTRGYHLFRSRDVNAPLPPLYLARPDSAYGVVRQIESNGRQRTDSLSVAVRGRLSKWLDGQAQYALGRAMNDTNGIGWFPANDYDLSGEYGRADFDRRHRFVALGRTAALRVVDIGMGFTANSPGPYTALMGADVYNNGRGGARPPGVARNSLQGAGYMSLDLRVSRDVKLRRRTTNPIIMTLGLDVFNATNRTNYGSFVGTVGSPLFGLPASAGPARQLQFSARVRF